MEALNERITKRRESRRHASDSVMNAKDSIIALMEQRIEQLNGYDVNDVYAHASGIGRELTRQFSDLQEKIAIYVEHARITAELKMIQDQLNRELDIAAGIETK